MKIEKLAQPNNDMRIEYGGKAITNFNKFEEQKRDIERLINKYPNSNVDYSSIIPDGKGNFILHNTQSMTLSELEEYINIVCDNKSKEELLKKERLQVANDYHILNPEELTKEKDNRWYFHGLPVDD